MKPMTYSIKAGEFKAKCLQLMDDVNQKHIIITITKHGKPVAKLVPVEETPTDFFGCLKNSVTIKQDITAPLDIDWEATQ